MAKVFCTTCKRITIQLLKGSCTDHSDWPPVNKPPRTRIDVVIPAYSPSKEINNQQAVAKMSHDPQGQGIVFKAGAPLLKEMGIKRVKAKAALTCTFCGVEVGTNEATIGQVKNGGTINLDFIDHERSTFYEKATPSFKHVVACPACCLNVGPIMNKQGKIVSQGIKWPESKG